MADFILKSGEEAEMAEEIEIWDEDTEAAKVERVEAERRAAKEDERRKKVKVSNPSPKGPKV